ncbi:chemosensory receptor a [Plakobranchus ocellatus]|uniref:Chemosensory receptor a n=1 Tax=Plakobranchus ocellatus TaxID=259542 RepID=A0AAV3ZCK6_9GAST|nr:chemosensory receptor a [Plakobranchus ocellatus]
MLGTSIATMIPEISNDTNISGCSNRLDFLIKDPFDIEMKHLDQILIYPIVVIFLFSILGLGTNILNIIVFLRMGLQETTTISMLALAVSDFFCCLLSLWTYLCFLPAFRDSANLPFRPIEVSLETGSSFRPYLTRTGALITAYISLERCLCVMIPMKVKNIITISVTRISIIIIYAITLLPYIAHQFQITLGWKFYPHLNKTLLGAVQLENPIATAFIQVNSYLCGFVYLFLADIIILVCTIFLVITLIRNSKWRDSITNQVRTPSDTPGDKKPGGTQKENRLIKMVVIIALLFTVCHTPGMAVIYFTATVPDVAQEWRYKPLYVLLNCILFAFEAVNNSLNFFIYYLMATKFRHVFHELICLKQNQQQQQ